MTRHKTMKTGIAALIALFALCLTGLLAIGLRHESVGAETARYVAKLTAEYNADTQSYTITGFDLEATFTEGWDDDRNDLAIVIPATYVGDNGERAVTAIADSAFEFLGGGYEFTSLDMSGATNLLNIGAKAFANRVMLSGELSIPDTVTTIGSGAFRGCESYTSFKFPNNSAFTEISDEVFYDCINLGGTLSIPTTVTSIGSGAFAGCNFSGELSIPDTVATIGIMAFGGCDFTSLKLPNNPAFTEISGDMFSGCRNLGGTLSIPNTVTSIGSGAFESCKFSGELIIPDTVTSIGACAFMSCENFTSLKFPNNPAFTTIEEYAFSNCVNLGGELIIPETVTSIGENAFQRCTKYTALQLPKNLVTIVQFAFFECSGFDGTLVIPNSVESIGAEAFSTLENIDTVYLPSGNTEYGVIVFDNVTCPIVAASEADYNKFKANDHTLSKYENLTYEVTVTFDGADGTVNDSQSITQEKLFGQSIKYEKNDANVWAINESYALPIATKTDGSFKGWRGVELLSIDGVVDAKTYVAQYNVPTAGLSGGAIAAIVISCVVLLLLILLILWLLRKKKKNEETDEDTKKTEGESAADIKDNKEVNDKEEADTESKEVNDKEEEADTYK